MFEYLFTDLNINYYKYSIHLDFTGFWGLVEAIPRLQPSTTGGTGHPGLAAGKGWRWEKLPSADGIMLNSRGERRTETLEGTEVEQQTPDTKGSETRGDQPSCSPHYVNSPRSSVALGDPPCLGGWPLIKINSLHNNIVIVINKISLSILHAILL